MTGISYTCHVSQVKQPEKKTAEKTAGTGSQTPAQTPDTTSQAAQTSISWSVVRSFSVTYWPGVAVETYRP